MPFHYTKLINEKTFLNQCVIIKLHNNFFQKNTRILHVAHSYRYPESLLIPMQATLGRTH